MSGLEEAHGTQSIGAAETAVWPHLGNDAFRAVGLLPGTASSEASSQVHIRGGRDDEVLVVLDGLELLAPYHLQEFDSALSIVAPSFLERVELSTGGYPAEYGDRMSGVIDMTTLTPPRSRRFELGLGLLYGEASASATLPGDRGRWYGAARGGNYHLALEVNGRDEKPSYWDTFGKLELAPPSRSDPAAQRPGRGRRLRAGRGRRIRPGGLGGRRRALPEPVGQPLPLADARRRGGARPVRRDDRLGRAHRPGPLGLGGGERGRFRGARRPGPPHRRPQAGLARPARRAPLLRGRRRAALAPFGHRLSQRAPAGAGLSGL